MGITCPDLNRINSQSTRSETLFCEFRAGHNRRSRTFTTKTHVGFTNTSKVLSIKINFCYELHTSSKNTVCAPVTNIAGLVYKSDLGTMGKRVSPGSSPGSGGSGARAAAGVSEPDEPTARGERGRRLVLKSTVKTHHGLRASCGRLLATQSI